MSPPSPQPRPPARIAHFSDTHVLSLKGATLRDFLNKRATGAVNLALNRAKHYRVEVFEQLLDAVGAAAPTHSVCTGDLVNLALAPEFERVRELLTARFAPRDLTLVPGNHDYYTKEAALAGCFEEAFAEYLPQDLPPADGARYPVTRLLGAVGEEGAGEGGAGEGGEPVAVVGLSSAIPTASFMATGELGAAQRARALELLADPALRGRFKLLMLHHPLFPDPARRLEATRRLRDAEALVAALDAPGAPAPDLVIHGHNHAFKRQALPRSGVPVVQVASASRAGRERAEFHVYVVEGGALARVERHVHDPASGRFVVCDESGAPALC